MSAVPVLAPRPAVLVIPGLASNQWAMALLRARLRRAGYIAQDWGQGFNVGPVEDDLDTWLAPVERRLTHLARHTGHPVIVLGWSLGGLAARELAKRHPRLVAQVVTLGTPVAGLAVAPHVERLYRRLNGSVQPAARQALEAQIRQEPPVPVLALLSHTDTAVPAALCRQPDPVRTRHLEFERVSHLGLVLSRRVFTRMLSALEVRP